MRKTIFHKIMDKVVEAGYEVPKSSYVELWSWEFNVINPEFWQTVAKLCDFGIKIGDYKGDIHVNHHSNGGKCTELCVVSSVKLALRFHELNLLYGKEEAMAYLVDILGISLTEEDNK